MYQNILNIFYTLERILVWKNQANNYAGTHLYSVGLAKMAIKRLQGNNREKYNYRYMYVSRYTCTIILKPHSSSVDKQCYIYIHFCHYLNHTLLSLPIASPSPGTITSPVLINVRFLPGQHCGLNNVSR